MKTLWLAAALLALTLPANAAITAQPWGEVDGKTVELFTLTNRNGMEAKITNYGGVITVIRVPDRNGTMANVTQGFDRLSDYTDKDYKGRFGALIGRYANRINDNSFAINGVTYHVGRDTTQAEGKPYDERVWSARTRGGAEPQLILSLLDKDGTMGFPGTLRVTVTYTLTKNNILRIAYAAVSDKDTVLSLTNHAYFNMAGDLSGPVLDQLLTVNADTITAGDDKNVPTGELLPVAGTAFDFRKPTPIGAHINDPDPVLQRTKGFDQNYAINGTPGTLRLAARLEDPKSGRVLEEWTTQAGLQVYSANYSPPPVGLAKGYKVHSSVALEAQAFPNAPNIPSFPTALLKAGAQFREVAEYRFSVAP